METMRERWICPNLDVQVFTPQEFVAVCDPEHMYTITPAPKPDGVDKVYMSSTDCGTGSFQGPVVPNGQPIDVSQDAYPQVMAMIKNSHLWALGAKNGNSFAIKTGYDYVSIATSSNSFGGHIDSSNVGTFRSTICDDNASQNALFVFAGEDAVTKNLS